MHRTSRPLLLKDVQSCWHRHGSSSLQDAVRTGASAFTAEEFYAQRAQVSDRIERVLGVLRAFAFCLFASSETLPTLFVSDSVSWALVV